MDNCSAEIISLILQYACAGDFGETARHLGLVSKYFRTIAEPIELQTIAVSGIEQLDGAITRLEKFYGPVTSNGSGMTKIDVRHLFVSELTREHALAADTQVSVKSSRIRACFWWEEEGKAAATLYREDEADFWRLVCALVRSARTSFQTLTLLASNNWMTWRGEAYIERGCAKVIGALSGVEFPNLLSLTVNHDAAAEINCLGENGTAFQPPTAQSLRKLHIMSRLILHRNANAEKRRLVHPLLASVYRRWPDLTHLIVCDGPLCPEEAVVRDILGEEWDASQRSRSLPGNLQSVVIKQGIEQHHPCGTGRTYYRREVHEFFTMVDLLHIDGLQARLPAPMFPEAGQREYELLLEEWKENVRASPL